METLHSKDSLRNWLIRYSSFFLGLVCFGLGVAISVKMRHLGLHPWDVLNIALFERFGLSVGTWTVIIGTQFSKSKKMEKIWRNCYEIDTS